MISLETVSELTTSYEGLSPRCLKYYGLHEDPFTSLPDEKYIYWSNNHHSTLFELRQAISSNKRMMLLTGSPGTGKTTLLNALLGQLPEKFRVFHVPHSTVGPEDFLMSLCKQLGIGFTECSLYELYPTFLTYLKISNRLGRKSLVIIDDAHKLTPETFTLIRKLIPPESSQNIYLQIVLIGDNSLQKYFRPAKPGGQSKQGNDFQLELGSLEYVDVRSYIGHLLSVAGCSDAYDVFSEDATKKIFELTNGVPSLINRITSRALIRGLKNQAKRINSRIIEEIEVDDNGHTEPLDSIPDISEFSTPDLQSIINKVEAESIPWENGAETANGEMLEDREEEIAESSELPDQQIEDNVDSPVVEVRESVLSETPPKDDITGASKIYDDDIVNDFQIILENLRTKARHDSLKVIGITSASSRQGTSTVAMMLSLLAAGQEIFSKQNGHSRQNAGVIKEIDPNQLRNSSLLIDTQFRSPSLHKKFNISPKYGLSDLLTSKVSLLACLTEIRSSGLMLITAGHQENFQLQSHHLEKLASLLQDLRQQSEFVFLDLPPLLPYAEAISLSRFCDGVIVVTRSGKCRFQVLEKARRLLEDADINLLGGVVNCRKFHIPNWLYKRL